MAGATTPGNPTTSWSQTLNGTNVISGTGSILIGSPMLGSCKFDVLSLTGALASGSGTDTITATLTKNGAVTTLTAQITTSATANVYTTQTTTLTVGNQIQVVAGDVVGLTFTQTNTSPVVRYGVTTRCQ